MTKEERIIVNRLSNELTSEYKTLRELGVDLCPEAFAEEWLELHITSSTEKYKSEAFNLFINRLNTSRKRQ